MVEVALLRKNKVNLSDYAYQKDIERRLQMANFSTFDLELIEEILYSPLQIPLRKLLETLDVSEEKLFSCLENLEKTGLFSFQQDTLLVDKQVRKYFELQRIRYDDDFSPDMEFLQDLLRKIPIQLFFSWYLIPRSSNNIFESIIERYLLSPSIFQRHLEDLYKEYPVLKCILNDVYEACDFKILASDLQKKYSLSPQEFEEYVLLCEFNFAACLSYKNIDGYWKAVLSPFQEWKEYLTFLKTTKPASLLLASSFQKPRKKAFAFVEDLSAFLKMLKKKPIQITPEGSFSKQTLQSLTQECKDFSLEVQKELSFISTYFQRIKEKSLMLQLAEEKGSILYPAKATKDFLALSLEERALFLYRHPLNSLTSQGSSPSLYSEKILREAEKSILRVLDSGWVWVDDLLKGPLVSLFEEQVIKLKKMGKSWQYALPTYNEEELLLIRRTILEWLFEAGVVEVGKYKGKDCFSVTSFGRKIFE